MAEKPLDHYMFSMKESSVYFFSRVIQTEVDESAPKNRFCREFDPSNSDAGSVGGPTLEVKSLFDSWFWKLDQLQCMWMASGSILFIPHAYGSNGKDGLLYSLVESSIIEQSGRTKVPFWTNVVGAPWLNLDETRRMFG
jgi:hypothetical protein